MYNAGLHGGILGHMGAFGGLWGHIGAYRDSGFRISCAQEVSTSVG